MNCIIVDERSKFLSDIETRLLIDDERNINLLSTLSSVDKLNSAIKSFQPDTLVICSNIAESQEDWDYAGVTIVGYSHDENGEKILKKLGIPSYGVISRTNELLNLMEGPIPTIGKRNVKSDDYEDDDNEDADRQRKTKPSNTDEQNKPVKHRNDELEDDDDRPVQKKKKPVDNTPEDRPVKKRRPESEESSSIASKRKSDKKLKKDGPVKKKKAKVVTVYSAKGGVGKTTVATELAVYLSLTSSGRGRLKVCIVDYNIDFGDVRSVLGLDVDGPDMSRWAMDIRERIEDGESPEDITYAKEEIREYLQVLDKTGLRALLAPLTHEESMDIGRQELDVMLRNLIHNGGFDFIVCDTGNNTRDSSVYALEAADTILLVSTQDATAATCNSSSMEALQKYGLDLRRVRMVINNCMAARLTGISVKEVEDAFLYPCIARIPHDTSVIRANNLSIPIVYQAKHDVTAAFRKIVNYLLGKQAVKTETPKKFSLKSVLGLK